MIARAAEAGTMKGSWQPCGRKGTEIAFVARMDLAAVAVLVTVLGLSPLQAPPAVRPAFRLQASAATSSDPPSAGFFPLVGVVVPGSHAAVGAGYRQYLPGTAVGAEASAMVSVRGYYLYRLRAGWLGPREHGVELRTADAPIGSFLTDATAKEPGLAAWADLRFRHYPRHRYFGIGPEADEADESNYLLRGASYDGVVLWQANRWFGLSGRVSWLASDIRRGRDPDRRPVEEVFDPRSVPGFVEEPDFLALGVASALDLRDNPGAPGRGLFAAAAVWRFDAADAAPFDFTRLVVDARAYAQPVWKRGTVAVRALLATDRVADRAAVPFFLQLTLGGSETLRGYDGYRWRDRALLHGTVEYRVMLREFIEVTPFVDVGTVGRSLSALDEDRFKSSVGVGVRAHYGDRVLARLEWARSREGNRLILATGPIF